MQRLPPELVDGILEYLAPLEGSEKDPNSLFYDEESILMRSGFLDRFIFDGP